MAVTRDNVKTIAATLAELTAQIPPKMATPSDTLAVATAIEKIVKVQEDDMKVCDTHC